MTETRRTMANPTTYAMVSDHNGPCSLVAEYTRLDDAIEAARTMDTDSAPTELEDLIGYYGDGDRDASGLLAAAEAAGWQQVAWADPGEYWVVLQLQRLP